METYIFKIIVCSSVLIGFYYLFLSEEKSFRFNRFYLIFALLFSYIIPFVSWEISAKEADKTGIVFQETAGEILLIPAKQIEAEINWGMIFLTIYGLITLFFLAKSIFSIIKISKLKGNFIKVNNLRTKLLEENISPFSFLGALYIGKNYFKNNSIDERIFLHEKNHIEQKHGIDLILIEVLKIFSWFNPALYFYKKAIITNHEFLADENVLSQNFEVKSYQQLILDEISINQNLRFTNPFNYNNTKKRFIMMTKSKSKFSQLKQLFVLPILALLTFLLVQKTYAADAISSSLDSSVNDSKNIFQNFKISNSKITISENPYKEFLQLLEKYNPLLKERKFKEFGENLTEVDKNHFGILWEQLNQDQKNSLPLHIKVKGNKDRKMNIPTENQMKEFSDVNKYAVWIDSKNISNSTLKNYKTTDFSNVFISKVYNNARSKKFPQPFQVTLTTNSEFIKQNKETGYIIGVVTTFYDSNIKNDTIRKPNSKVFSEIPPPPPPKEERVKSNTKEVSYMPPPPPPTSTMTDADQLPEFPGGFNVFRNQVASSFNGAVLTGDEKLLKSTISFVIDVDGKISNVSAHGENEIFNNEAARTAKAVNENQTWKPAMKDGKPVRYRFTMPLTMSFGN